MEVVWQMVDATLIPILTYACEGWAPNKEEENEVQAIFNEAINKQNSPSQMVHQLQSCWVKQATTP